MQWGEAVEQETVDKVARSDASARDDGSDTARDEGRKRKADVLGNDGAADIKAGIGGENGEVACGGVEGEGQDGRDGSGSDSAESGSSAMSAAATQLQPSGATTTSATCGAAPDDFDAGPLTPATRPRREPGANRSR